MLLCTLCKEATHAHAHTHEKNVVSYFRKKRQGECMVYFQISVILPLKLKRSDARKLHSKNFLFIWSFTYFSPQFPGHIGKDIKNHSVRISAGLVSREISTSVSQFEVLQVHVLWSLIPTSLILIRSCVSPKTYFQKWKWIFLFCFVI